MLKKPKTIQLDIVADEPATTHGLNFDRAKHYLQGFKECYQKGVAYQVLLGFELVDLKKQFGVKNGSKSHLCQNGKGTWEDILKHELGLARNTAYRFESMARAVTPKLKASCKHLFDVPLLDSPIADLPEPTQKALIETTKKLTSGFTQADFLRELGLIPTPKSKGGARPHEKKDAKTIAEQHSSDNRETFARIMSDLQVHMVAVPVWPDVDLPALHAAEELLVSCTAAIRTAIKDRKEQSK